MNKEEIIDKLVFYRGFLDSFIHRSIGIMRENDIQSLRMLREYMIMAIKELREVE